MVRFTCNDLLLKALANNNVHPQDYKPAYGGESVGLDLYYAGENEIVLHHGSMSVMVPTGLKVAIPLGHVGLILERGSIRKTPLTMQAGVIDPGYTGEVWIPVRSFYNFGVSHGHYNYTIEPLAKLPFQLVVLPCITDMSICTEELYSTLTASATRGERQQGSTNVA